MYQLHEISYHKILSLDGAIFSVKIVYIDTKNKNKTLQEIKPIVSSFHSEFKR